MKNFQPKLLAAPLLLAAVFIMLPSEVSAFAPPSSIRFNNQIRSTAAVNPINPPKGIGMNHETQHAVTASTSTKLQALPQVVSLARNAFTSTSTGRMIAILTAATILATQYQRILWPKSSPDRSIAKDYPLPPGSFGCPLIGTTNLFAGDKENGPGLFWRKMSTKFGNSRIFKFFAFGRPFVGVFGSQNIKAVLSSEFQTPGVVRKSSSFGRIKKIRGTESLVNCDDRDLHAYLRRLIRTAMTVDALSPALPKLQVAASNQIDKLLDAPEAKMEDYCIDFTFDVSWRQILGLKLNEADALKFKKALIDWVAGFKSVRTMILPGSKSEKARHYIDSLILQRIEELKRKGPDGSTLSAMVFASTEDEDGVHRKLTQQQILDNSVGIIFAGTETSASTLTTAMLLLGLHPNVWNKVVEEQQVLVSKHGENLTKEQLDTDCQYLDAVIKETMRIKPVALGLMRIAKDTLIIDGKQIPKGYSVMSSLMLTHERDPITWKEDGSHMDVMVGFQPERWLDETTRPSDEYLPFGYGAHFCIGNNLAMMEMKVFLSLMARRVDFSLVNDHETSGWIEQSIIPKPGDGCLITARPRQNAMAGTPENKIQSVSL